MAERDALYVSEQEYLDKYAAAFYEWVDGELIPVSPILLDHDVLQDYLRDWLKIYLSLNPIGRVVGSPFVMRLPLIPSWREPDLQVILHGNPGQLTETAMIGPADICIEIVSPESVERDYVDKMLEYQRAGVPEYWLFYPKRRDSRFYRLNAAGVYATIQPDADGYYTTSLLPRFKLPVATLWAENKPNTLAIADLLRAMLADDPTT
jgi:Uma2 family endonuclease